MSTECFVQFNKEGEPKYILTHDQIKGQPRVELCHIYTHDDHCDMMRVGGNNETTARFAGKLIGDLGFRIPHPEFYPDEYEKFEEDWAEFIKTAKDHQMIIRLLVGLIHSTLTDARDEARTELKKLGVIV